MAFRAHLWSAQNFRIARNPQFNFGTRPLPRHSPSRSRVRRRSREEKRRTTLLKISSRNFKCLTGLLSFALPFFAENISWQSPVVLVCIVDPRNHQSDPKMSDKQPQGDARKKRKRNKPKKKKGKDSGEKCLIRCWFYGFRLINPVFTSWLFTICW